MATFIQEQTAEIVGLGLNTAPYATHARQLRAAVAVDEGMVFYGRSFVGPAALGKFARLAPDLGLCCGFAPILPTDLLRLPKWGWMNVHRSYLPYNRGLDPIQWALVDGTPAGVSLHVMTEQVDAGGIVAQAEVPILPVDDAESLGARIDEKAFELVRSCWPRLRTGRLDPVPQDESLATYHNWADCEALRHLNPNATVKVRRLLNILRGYTAGGVSGAYFEVGPFRYTVHTQVKVAQQLQSRTGASNPAPPPYLPGTDIVGQEPDVRAENKE